MVLTIVNSALVLYSYDNCNSSLEESNKSLAIASLFFSFVELVFLIIYTVTSFTNKNLLLFIPILCLCLCLLILEIAWNIYIIENFGNTLDEISYQFSLSVIIILGLLSPLSLLLTESRFNSKSF